MSTFITYAVDGRITAMQSPGDADGLRRLLQEQGTSFIEFDPSIDRAYVDPATGQLRMRPLLANAPDKTSAAIDEAVSWGEIPAGSTVEILGALRANLTHESGELALSFGLAGTYEVRIEAFPARVAIFKLQVA